MKVCYVGPVFDYTGYGEANRHFVKALHEAGVDVRVVPVSYVHDIADFGALGQLCKELSQKTNDYDVKILHVTPDQYKRFIEPGKYHIGHLFWETSIIPPEFADGAKLMQEIWTGSETNADAIAAAGVSAPIFVAPQPIETEREPVKPYQLPNFDGYLFYSIFEWTERKNPRTLIRAFYEEFSDKENVGLLVKTYYKNFSERDSDYLTGELKRLKREYGAGRAPVMAFRHLMDRHQINRLHETGDCFVSAHRGEGWGIPIAEAMVYGKPAITTGYNGINDYLTEETAYRLPYKMIPVEGIDLNTRWYTPDQRWANVEITDLRATLRRVYNQQQEAAAVGKAGQDYVKTNFSFKAVGAKLKQRIELIEGAI